MVMISHFWFISLSLFTDVTTLHIYSSPLFVPFPFNTTLSAKGSFVPSGYFLKAVFLHSGQAVSRYSDPLYDLEPTRFPSFQLLSEPIDVFQGRERAGLNRTVCI